MFWGFKVLGFWSSHGLGRVLMFRVSGSGGEGAKERKKNMETITVEGIT